MIILDTNVISEEMKARPSAEVVSWFSEQASAALFTTSVCEAEIRLGLAVLPEGQRKQQLVLAANRVLDLFQDRILSFDSRAAIEYAEIVATRRQLGRPINELRCADCSHRSIERHDLGNSQCSRLRRHRPPDRQSLDRV